MLFFTIASPLPQPLLHPKHLSHQLVPRPPVFSTEFHSGSPSSHPDSGRIPRSTSILRRNRIRDREIRYQHCPFLRWGELGGVLEGSDTAGQIEDTIIEHRWADDPSVCLPLSTCPPGASLQGHELFLQVLVWAIGSQESDQWSYPDVGLSPNALSRQEDRTI